MAVICTENHGPLIVSSSFWGSEYDRGGKLYCSCNAGCVRVLVPSVHRSMIEECRGSQYVILSRGPWPEMRLPDAVELLFEDGTESPFALHLSPESFDLLPAEPEPGKEWTLAIYDCKKNKPHKAVERRCFWRRVEKIPWLKPWEN